MSTHYVREDYPNLAPVAISLFHLSPSSATAERSFSAIRQIHTRLRSRLGADKLEKLTYFKMNWPVAFPDIKDDLKLLDIDAGEDVAE